MMNFISKEIENLSKLCFHPFSIYVCVQWYQISGLKYSVSKHIYTLPPPPRLDDQHL